MEGTHIVDAAVGEVDCFEIGPFGTRYPLASLVVEFISV